MYYLNDSGTKKIPCGPLQEAAGGVACLSRSLSLSLSLPLSLSRSRFARVDLIQLQERLVDF